MALLKPLVRSILVMAAAFTAVGGLSFWLIDRFTAVHTSDARVRASMVAISSDIAGRIVDLPVSAGDRVEAGDILARLDDREASLVIAALSLELKSLEAEVERERLRANLSKTAGENRIGGRKAALAAARADFLSAAARLKAAQADFDRRIALKASGLVTQATTDRTFAELESVRQEEARARAAIAQGEAGVGEAKAEAGEADIVVRSTEALSLHAHALRQQIALREMELSQHVIKSPIDGVIDEVFADAGEYVSPGARIALAHDPAHVWIEANVKETEIARIADDAHVEARLDAAAERVCAGRTGSMLLNTWAIAGFGMRQTFIAAMCVFIVGSAIGAASTGLEMLVLGRMLQGAGPGLIQPMAMLLVFRFFPESSRGTAIGLYSLGVILSPAFGPVIGGLLATCSTGASCLSLQRRWRCWRFFSRRPSCQRGQCLAPGHGLTGKALSW